MQVRMRKNHGLEHADATRDHVHQDTGHRGIEHAFAVHEPASVQRAKAWTGEGGLGTVEAFVQVDAAIPTGMEVPPDLVNDVGRQRGRQLLGKRLTMQAGGAGQVTWNEQPDSPRRQAAQQLCVPLEEQAEVDRRPAGDEVQKDVCETISPDANWLLVRE